MGVQACSCQWLLTSDWTTGSRTVPVCLRWIGNTASTLPALYTVAVVRTSARHAGTTNQRLATAIAFLRLIGIGLHRGKHVEREAHNSALSNHQIST